MFKNTLLFIFFILSFNNAHAKLFKNNYVSFYLPDQWKCYREGTEWICRSQVKEKAKQAVIILTAKEVGPKDTYTNYYDHLKSPRELITKKGSKVKSKTVHLKKVRVGGHEWIDGMHLGSEVPNYYTRYLATIKNQIAVLVTFSAHQKYYTQYSKEFFRAIKSLRVIARKDLFQKKDNSLQTGEGTLGVDLRGQLGAGTDSIAPDVGSADSDMNFAGDEKAEGNSGSNILLGIAIILASVGGYLWYRGSQKR